jgi:cytochrome b561
MYEKTPTLTSRLLHLLLATGVTLQLLLSTFMERPRPGVSHPPLEALGFRLHEIVGLTLLPAVLGWFLWLLLRRREPSFWDLFPWLHAGRTRLVQATRLALAEARQGRLAPESEIQPLIRTVHGLGALCVLFMAVTGSLVWWGMSATGALPNWAGWVLDLHQVAANLMWAYLIGHAGMALLHHRRGDATLRRMFTLRRLSTVSPRSGESAASDTPGRAGG